MKSLPPMLAAFTLAVLPLCNGQLLNPLGYGPKDLRTIHSTSADGRNRTACADACAFLRSVYGKEQVITKSSNIAGYENFRSGYWSTFQREAAPECIFKPRSAQEVATQIRVSNQQNCSFAVKSGGHAAFAGASSNNGGITVSLENMKQITIRHDSRTASIGPGNIWSEVYSTLEQQNLTVVGGRVAGIGVGGLTTGGGLSFFSNLYGWACDNVASYQVALANGSVVHVSASQNEDLYWALRGGGPNFGIVTNFELKTFPLPRGLIWSGSLTHSEDKFPALVKAFVNLGIEGLEKDPNAAQIFSVVSYQGQKLASVYLSYAKPIANASVFDDYLAVPDPLAGFGDTQIRTLSNATLEFAKSNPDGLRESYWARTYKLTTEMSKKGIDTFFEEIQPVLDAANILPAASLQTITKNQVRPMLERGGNPLGLRVEDAPYLLFECSVMWTDSADDARILQAYHTIFAKLDAYAKGSGAFEDYTYMNYASQFQDVIASYGAANKAKLQGIAREYDPNGVFQRLQPGYFGFNGAPADWSAFASGMSPQ